MKSFQVLVDLVESAKQDAEKFEKGNSAAGTRLRKKMQEIRTLACLQLVVISRLLTKEKENPRFLSKK